MPRASKEVSRTASRRATLFVRSAAATSPSRSKSTLAKRLKTAKPSTSARSVTTPKRSSPSKRKSEANETPELKEFAQRMFKYFCIYQTTAASMWGDPDEVYAAHARELKICLENRCAEPETPEEAEHILDGLAIDCEIIPKSFDDRIRICFAAQAYTRVLMENVVCHSSRPFNDRLVVFRLLTKMNREAQDLPPPPPDLPRLVNLIPDKPVTRPVSLEDVERWRAHPKKLLRKAFISYEGTRRVFLVSDYCIKEIAGHCYDVRFEDCGPDVLTFGLEDVLGMVTGADFVTNMQTNV